MKERQGQGVLRVFLITHAISTFGEEWFTVRQVMPLTNLPKSTLHRYLPAFVKAGILEREMRGKYMWYHNCYKRRKQS